MSSKKKLLEKLRSRKKNIRCNELLSLMKAFGFTWREKTDGYIFKHELLQTTKLVNVAKPHRQGDKVLVCYIDECLEAIEMVEDKENLQ